MTEFLETLKKHLTSVLLVILAILAFLGGQDFIDRIYLIPALILTVVAAFFRIERFIEHVDVEAKKTAEHVADVRDNLKIIAEEKRLVEVINFGNRNTFYTDLIAMLNKSEKSVKLTAIRENPPDEIKTDGQSDEWYEAVVRWAKESPGERVVDRVVAVGNDKMQKWAETLKKHLSDEDVTNFDIHTIDWSIANRMPMINTCIFDDKIVYIIYTPQSGRMADSSFVRIDSQTATNFFNEYYRDLLHCAKTL